MRFDDLHKCWSLLSCAEAHEAHDPRVLQTVNDGQLTEVLVQSGEYAALAMREFQDRLVARIIGPFARPDYVVPSRLEITPRSAPHAAVEKQLQAERFSITNGSTCS